MGSRAQVFVLCLLCVARASVLSPKEIAEIGEESLAHVQHLPITAVREAGNGTERADKFREKRALGLLLSGLAQIFGYTVTPIQIASLPNPTGMPAMGGGQQVASSRPMAMNATASKRQETIRFTGVVNFGNNSDIIGHLQRYERIFHGNATIMNMTSANMTSPRPPTPTLPAFLMDPRTTNAGTKPPLLAPFFVKIPLPIAPNLVSLDEISYPVSPLISVVTETSGGIIPPARKEQETVYRNNEDTERYTVEQKDIYDEKDVQKPASKYTHQLYLDEPRWQKQQEDRYNEVQRGQEGQVLRLKEQERESDRDSDREDEIDEKQRHREQEIAHRNREHVSRYKPTEGRKPAYNEEEDEDATRDSQEEYVDPANVSSESAKQPAEDEREKAVGYVDYDDPDEELSEQQRAQPPPPPNNLDKYVEPRYNQQLPIGDYFHEGNTEGIRDSYGEVLDERKQDDDRLSGYFSMFKHPYQLANAFDSQQVHNVEDASGEDDGPETPSAKAYDEHLARVEKLREEYALPAPRNKYEEYDLNDESETDSRDDRQSEGARAPTNSKGAKAERGKEKTRTKATNSSRMQPVDDGATKSADAKSSRRKIEPTRYTPLIVPVRYIDADVDKTAEQTTTRRLKYEKPNGGPANGRIIEDNAVAVSDEKPTAQIGLPARPRQLHEEGEQGKNFQVWPPPFDYAFDNTVQTNTILPPDTRPSHYQQVLTNVAANDANSSEQPSGYLVVVGNSVEPHLYPRKIYYFPNEVVRPQNPQLQPSAEGKHPQRQLYASKVNVDRQLVRAYPNLTEYNQTETNSRRANYYQTRDYHQPRESLVDIRDRYVFEERVPQASERSEINERGQIFNTDNWSSKIYRPQSIEQSPSPRLSPLVQLRNLVTRNARSGSSGGQPDPGKRDGSRNERHKAVHQRKPFDDPQSAHDFFGFSKNDYSFDDGESGDGGASKVAEQSDARRDTRVPDVPKLPAIAHHRDESLVKQTDEPEHDAEKAKVTEYRNKVATLRVSEQRRLTPNGPTHYVDYTRNI